MKNTLLVRITLAALAIVLLGSCEKINQRIDALEERIDGIETEKIASIDSQIASINSSIADLGTIRSNVTSLRSQVDDHSTDIFNLEEADRALKDRILNLEDYLDDVLPTYAEKDWVKATFSTLAQYEATCDTIAKIDARIGKLDERLSKEIKACADSMKKWVNVQFEAYYTAAEMDAALEYMQAEIDSAKVSGKITDERVDSLANELTKTKAAVDSAKAQLTREYKAAIDTAITHLEGNFDRKLQQEIEKVNADITALTTRVSNLEVSVATLTGRVDKLEKMIQSVTIVPAYSDGSVKVANDSLYLDFIVSPASAIANLAKGNVTVLVNKVKTKAFAGVDSIKIGAGDLFEKDAAKGSVSVRVSVAGKIPAITDSTITVAVNVQNGISDFTTEFVPITLPVRVSLDKHSIVVQSPDSDKDTTLTATVKYAKNKSVNWTSTNHGVAAVNNQGKVTITANKFGKDTVVVKTVEGNATDTCFITVLPEGALAGVFTVNAEGKKVYFSQGNLVATIDATGDPTAWKFAANQYEYIGANVANTKIGKEAGDVDFFGWSTDATSNNWGIHTKTSATNNVTTGYFKDWGKAVGDGNTWRTLSKTEWTYLVNKDDNDNIRKGKYKYGVTVCGKTSCLILAPDNFEGTIAESYDAAAWASAEAAGLVCLPAAGDRIGSGVGTYGTYGFYWTSSKSGDEEEAYDLHFTGSEVNPGGRREKRHIGCSVRLVTEVK